MSIQSGIYPSAPPQWEWDPSKEEPTAISTPEHEIAAEMQSPSSQDSSPVTRLSPADARLTQSISDRAQNLLKQWLSNSPEVLQRGLDVNPHIKERLTQMRDDFFPTTQGSNSSSRNRSSTWFSYRSYNLNFFSGGSYSGRSSNRDDRMQVITQICVAAISIGAALILAFVDGKCTRRIDEANNSNHQLTSRTNVTDEAQLRGLNGRIIAINKAKQWHARIGLVFAITGVAAAVFASYPVLWVGIIGAAATGVSAIHRYASGRFTEIATNDVVYNSLVKKYGFNLADRAV